MFEPGQIGRESNISKSVGLAGKPAVSRKALLHFFKQLNHALQCNNKVL